MEASVVIPTHNRSAKLASTLARLAEQDHDGEWEVVVVDNNCTDDTAAVVAGLALPVPLRLVRETKPGPSAARNTGTRAARSERVVFIDDDILVAPSFVRLHVVTARANPGHWLVGQVETLPEQRRTPFGRYRHQLHPPADPALAPFEIDWFASGNASLVRSQLLELGGYNEAFETAALEDADLALRAMRAGIGLLYVPAIVAVHDDWAGSTIADYCQRQRVHCRSVVILDRRFGSDHARSEVVRRNSPPAPGSEPLATTANKLAKSVLATAPVSRVLFGLVSLLERAPERVWPVLPRLYRLLIASWMYKGTREGFAAAVGR